MRLFRTFRNDAPETRDQLLADVKARFAAMSPAEWADFLTTIPEQNRPQAERLRALAVQ